MKAFRGWVGEKIENKSKCTIFKIYDYEHYRKKDNKDLPFKFTADHSQDFTRIAITNTPVQHQNAT